jgi:CxxC-x17-CxxC domain-containing protein
LSEEVRDAVFGNVGTIVALRIGAQDAEFLEKEFEPHFRAEDLVNLTKFQMCLKLMIDGVASRPFSAFSLPPLHEGAEHIENKDKVIKVSRERYSKPADQVEDKIVRWMGLEDVGETETEVEGRVKRFDENRAKPAQPTANAVCDNCAKPTYIAFKPDDKRNVFCKDCLPKFKQGVIDAGSLTKRNIAAPATQPRIEPRSKSDAAKVSETAGQAKPARQERTADLASQPAHTPQNQTPTDGNVAPGQIVELNK